MAGLSKATAFNGRLAVLMSFDDLKGRWLVTVRDSAEQLYCKAKNFAATAFDPQATLTALRRFEPGQQAALQNLEGCPELNGTGVVLSEICWTLGRWAVRTTAGEELLVRPRHLRAPEAA